MVGLVIGMLFVATGFGLSMSDFAELEIVSAGFGCSAFASGCSSSRPSEFKEMPDQFQANTKQAVAVPIVGSQKRRRPMAPQAAMKMNNSAIGTPERSVIRPSEFRDRKSD